MRRLIVSPQAAADVDRLEQWLWDRGADEAALGLAPLLTEAFDTLFGFPERGFVGRTPFFRHLVVPFGAGGYVIQYRVTADAIVVARVRHSRERS